MRTSNGLFSYLLPAHLVFLPTICVHTAVWKSGGQRSMSGAFLSHSLPFLLRQAFMRNLELSGSAKLAFQWAPGLLPSASSPGVKKALPPWVLGFWAQVSSPQSHLCNVATLFLCTAHMFGNCVLKWLLLSVYLYLASQEGRLCLYK